MPSAHGAVCRLKKDFYVISASLGLNWENEELPEDMYQVQHYRNIEDQSPSWLDLEDCDGAAEILKWIYGAKVLNLYDEQVIFGDELRFVVLDCTATFSSRGCWQCRCVANDIRMQEMVVFIFQNVGNSPRYSED